jgi:hypothetical protein
LAIEINDEDLVSVRKLIKDSYRALGQFQGAKAMGLSQVNIDECINTYKTLIDFAEVVIQEPRNLPSKKTQEIVQKLKDIRENKSSHEI